LAARAETKRNKPKPRGEDPAVRPVHHGAMFHTALERARSMKPWIKTTLAGLFGASIVLGSLAAFADGPCRRYGPMDAARMAELRGKVLDRVGRKLDLSDAQKHKLAAVADRLQARRAAFTAEAGDLGAGVQALVAGDRFDRARAQALLDAKLHAAQAGGPDVMDAVADFYDSLDAAQQQKVRDFVQRRRGWLGRRG